MPIESNKISQTCRYCNKEYANLGLHIIKQHPSILEQLEEREPLITSPLPNPPQNVQNAPILRQSVGGSEINAMVREKLDTMLNIMIIRMLSENPNTSITDVQKILNPPQQQNTLADLKAYHDMVFQDKPQANINVGGDAGGWLELATAALPIIAQMLPNKKAEIEKNDAKPRSIEEGSFGIRRLVSEEIADDRTEPSSIGGESSPVNETKQSDNSVFNIVDKGA